MTALRAGLRIARSSLARACGSARERLGDLGRVARFLRGSLEFRVRPDDVFISSYPRSGTTWLQHILHVLAHDGDSGFAHISDVVPWYERSLALGRSRAQDFERLPSPRIFKSHLPYAWLPHGARYVYALRDGRDVAVSYHQLYRSHLGSRAEFDAFFDRFLRGALQYGSWFDHVAAWRAVAKRPEVRIVRYEALVQDLPGQMRELCAFCGLSRSPERIAELARLCSFAAMKRDEERFDHATEQGAAGDRNSGAFLRVGRTGTHASVLSPSQKARFETERGKRRRHPRRWQLHAFLH